MKQYDLILETLMEIKEDVGSINEHLKTLNGKVLNHRERILSLEKDNQKNKIMWAKIGAVATTISVGVSLIFRLIIS